MKMKLIRAALALLLLLSLAATAACGKQAPKKTTAVTTTLPPTTTAPLTELYDRAEQPTDLVCISVEGYGDIVVELYPEEAPITVANFKKLVGQGFYTSSTFHRVIYDFMIQGGISASGARAETITGEFAQNGHQNDLLHTRGVISMARTDAPNSASSQFFIVQTAHADWLDGKYAAFGKVVYGMDTVDRIAAVGTDYFDEPLQAVTIREAFFVREK